MQNFITLVPDPAEAMVVKQIFQLRNSGMSMRKISSYLNKNDISIRGKKWAHTDIQCMLRNKVYKGEYSYNGSVERNEIKFLVEPIITKKMFGLVNK